MHYDQSWMGYGIVGGVQAGLIAVVAGLLFFGLFHWLGRRYNWNDAQQIGWALLLGFVVAGGGDLSDLFYFNYAPLESLQLLKAKLALIHDPDHIGTRVLCEALGVMVGVCVGWLAGRIDWGRWFRPGG